MNKGFKPEKFCIRMPVKMSVLELVIFTMIFNDPYRIITFRAVEINMKCKYLWDFPAVIPRALC
jgi:hypothetical protein